MSALADLHAPATIHRACPACGADAPRPAVSSRRRAEAMPPRELAGYWTGLLKERVFFSYARCGCGQLYAPTFFAPAALEALYGDMAPNMDVVPPAMLARTQGGYWRATLAADPPAGGYLELGPDLGPIVAHAAADGRYDRFWLAEPNRAVHGALAAACGGRPHAILTDLADLSPVPDGSVALAVMVHVLDHLLDPLESLRAVHAKLKPGGRLVIVTHDEGSAMARLLRARWPAYCLQHPELFNPRSIAGLAARAGFADARVTRTRNWFPLDFLARQAGHAAGLDLSRLPLPRRAVGLKLGNMLTVATR